MSTKANVKVVFHSHPNFGARAAAHCTVRVVASDDPTIPVGSRWAYADKGIEFADGPVPAYVSNPEDQWAERVYS